MAVEEAVLESVAGGAPPTLRLYSWDRPTLSLGSAQSAADVDAAACLAEGVHIVRRQSGGAAVLLDSGQLGYSLVLPTGHPFVPRDVVETYRLCGRPVEAALRELGLSVRPAEVGEARASQAATAVDPVARGACLATVAPYELLLDGRKVVAHAQARRRAVLVHGLVLVRRDVRAFTRLLALASVDRNRLSELLEQRVGELVGGAQDLTVEAVAEALAASFGSVPGAHLMAGRLTEEEQARAAALQRGKYGAADWTFRR